MRRTPAVLRESPQFRLLFAGQALSLIGDRITFVALPFAVLAAGGSLTHVGLVVAAQTVPFALFSLAAGVIADRLDRRRIMIASDAVRMLCQIAAGLLLVTGAAEPWHLAVFAFAYGAADAFFSPSMTGLMPEVVPPVHLQQANALRAMTMSLGSVAGPALAGLLILAVGPGGALLADAGTFAVSIACLYALRPGAAERLEEPEATFLGGLRGGWREVRSRSWVSAFLGLMAGYHLFVLPGVFVLGPVLADRSLGGAGAWALITAAFGAGSGIGNLILLRWRPPRPLLMASLFAMAGSMQAAILGSGLPLPAIAGLEALAGVCVTMYFTLWETSIQEHIPGHAISRVSSYDYLLSVGSLPLGAAIAAPVADAVGLRPTMFAMTLLGIAGAAACLAVPSVRRLGRGVGATAPAR